MRTPWKKFADLGARREKCELTPARDRALTTLLKNTHAKYLAIKVGHYQLFPCCHVHEKIARLLSYVIPLLVRERASLGARAECRLTARLTVGRAGSAVTILGAALGLSTHVTSRATAAASTTGVN